MNYSSIHKPLRSNRRRRCNRCRCSYIPDATGCKNYPYSRFCRTCQVRNIYDGLDLPMPPALLDIYTKNPTLTDASYQSALAQVSAEPPPE